MKSFALFSWLAAAASATVIKRQNTGDGPYSPAGYITDASLPRHTIYRPETPPEEPMPVLVWGNGACSADGTGAQNFLGQVASHGFLAISAGTPGGGGSSTVEWMTEAVEWAVNGANGLFNVDTTRIMAAGYSCGGTEAYEMQNNPAVSALGIFNSGLLSNYEFASQITKPILFALGGPDDIAYPNGERDYAALPADLPTWKGNLNAVGHGGTYGETNGGLFAKAAANWMLWLYKGDAEAGAYFAEGAATADGWNDAVSRNIEGLAVPISA
jgi:poly(3-hydroxybutyrate) depolymerase